MDKFLKVLDRICIGVFIVSLVFLLSCFLTSFNWFPIEAAAITTNSMGDSLKEDSLAIVLKTNNISEGDIIYYEVRTWGDGAEEADDMYFCSAHRVVSMEDGTLRTAGDESGADAYTVEMNDVHGKVVCSVPGIGGLIADLQNLLDAFF